MIVDARPGALHDLNFSSEHSLEQVPMAIALIFVAVTHQCHVLHAPELFQ